jgi:catechol 2,3-dioxygenase-like lactoylglutathione lyase family enzyme
MQALQRLLPVRFPAQRRLAMDLTRRGLLGSFGILAAARGLTAQAKKSSIRVRALNHMTLTVADPHRSLEFYQGLFGLPVQARQGDTTILRIGSGPQFVALSKGGANAKPGIGHFCMTVENFNVEQIMKTLAEYGVSRTDTAGAGPLKAWVRKREEGTAELYFTDADGILVQLQDTSYCGGAGVLGNVCLAKAEPAPRKGLIAARDFSHFTLMVADARRSREFYQGLFGLRIQAYQGAAPVLGVGARGQFLALAAGSAAPNIGHACLNMEGFDPDKVLRTLSDFGVLKSYVTMRMEDRGGARGGTPELYFTDPDGILMQLQDVNYCGGAGYLGDECPVPA